MTTKAALRAARRLFPQYIEADIILEAKLIDEETALPKLLAACQSMANYTGFKWQIDSAHTQAVEALAELKEETS